MIWHVTLKEGSEGWIRSEDVVMAAESGGEKYTSLEFRGGGGVVVRGNAAVYGRLMLAVRDGVKDMRES